MGYEFSLPPAVSVLEDIAFWKKQEQYNTALIKLAVPGLQEPYVKLLGDWETVFGATEGAARQLLESGAPAAAPGSPEYGEAEALALAAAGQSREWIRQLHSLREAFGSSRDEAAEICFTRSVRESEYLLCILNGTRPAGASTGLTRNDSGNASPAGDAAGDTSAAESSGARDKTYVPIGEHKLPPLPYPYNALEPYIDEKTMRIHHDKHHQSYVDGLNKAEKKLAEARKSGNFDLVKHWERELAFNGAGHYLHTIFWDEMSPQGGGRPTGALLAAIDRDFGSYDAFKKQFSAAAEKVEGGGWAILVWSPRSRRLEILTAEKHQNLSQWDVVPLLALDVWEHAYYLKHQNNRAAYIEDWWKVVNWPYVSERYNAASKLAWKPY
ncbi:Superoxide dismutase [Mn/Fe] [compost metagenome]